MDCTGDWGNSLKSVLDNWLPLQKLWQESLSGGGLQPELRGRIIGVQAQIETFEYYFGVTIMQKILGNSDNLPRSIQSPDLTATDAKYLANCAVETLEKIRNDRDFDLFWNNLNEKADSLDLREPKQPRKRKVPQKLLEIDNAITTYETNFENIEQQLLSAVHGKCTKPWVDEVRKTNEGDINIYLLNSHLESLSVEFKNKDSICIRDITNHIKELGSKTIMF